MNTLSKLQKLAGRAVAGLAIAFLGVTVLLALWGAVVKTGASMSVVTVFMVFAALAAIAVALVRRFRPGTAVQVCVLLGLSALFLMLMSMTTYNDFGGDLMYNYVMAGSFLEENPQRDNFYTATFPGTLTYPFILSLVMRLTGLGRGAHVLLNHAAVISLAVAIYFLLRRKMPSHWALAGSLLVSLHPYHIIYSLTPNAELPFGACAVASFAALAAALCATDRRARLLFAALSAALCGFSQFFRPLGIVLLIAFLMYILLFSDMRARERALISGVFVAFYMLFSFSISRFVKSETGYDPPSSAYGWNLYVGSSDNGWWNTEDGEEFSQAVLEFDTPTGLQQHFAGKAVDRYLERGFGGTLSLFAHKFCAWLSAPYLADTVIRQFDDSPFDSVEAWGTYLAICAIYDMPLMLASLVYGVWLFIEAIRGRPRAELVLVLFTIGSMAAFMVLEVAPRYMIPYRMVFSVLAMYGFYAFRTSKHSFS